MAEIEIESISPMLDIDPPFAVATVTIKLEKPDLDAFDNIQVRSRFAYDESISVADLKAKVLLQATETLRAALAAIEGAG